MESIIVKNYRALSLMAADLVCQAVKIKPTAVIALPTGATPLGMYRELARRARRGQISFAKARFFNLDEYVGLSPDDSDSYNFYLRRNFLEPAGVNPKNCHLLNGQAKNLTSECREHEKKIKQARGLDLAILGLGLDGHLGFNEPGTKFSSITHIVKLTASTRKRNQGFFAKKQAVPTRALTMGLKTIISAKQILLLVDGQAKSRVLLEMLKNQPTIALPATILHKHKKAILLTDIKI